MTQLTSRFGHLATDRAKLNADTNANRQARSAGIVPGLVIFAKGEVTETTIVAQAQPKPESMAATPIDRSYAGGFAAANARAAAVFASGAIKGREVFAVDMLVNTDLPAESIIALLPKCIGDASVIRVSFQSKANGPVENHGWAAIHTAIADRRAEKATTTERAN